METTKSDTDLARDNSDQSSDVLGLLQADVRTCADVNFQLFRNSAVSSGATMGFSRPRPPAMSCLQVQLLG